ncbi:hypothetical protein PHYSODRAFT_354014, partial [Phytophthora sojae]
EIQQSLQPSSEALAKPVGAPSIPAAFAPPPPAGPPRTAVEAPPSSQRPSRAATWLLVLARTPRWLSSLL